MPEQEAAAHMPPPPETLSAEARAYLGALVPMTAVEPIDLRTIRPFTVNGRQTLGSPSPRSAGSKSSRCSTALPPSIPIPPRLTTRWRFIGRC